MKRVLALMLLSLIDVVPGFAQSPGAINIEKSTVDVAVVQTHTLRIAARGAPGNWNDYVGVWLVGKDGKTQTNPTAWVYLDNTKARTATRALKEGTVNIRVKSGTYDIRIGRAGLLAEAEAVAKLRVSVTPRLYVDWVAANPIEAKRTRTAANDIIEIKRASGDRELVTVESGTEVHLVEVQAVGSTVLP